MLGYIVLESTTGSFPFLVGFGYTTHIRLYHSVGNEKPHKKTLLIYKQLPNNFVPYKQFASCIKGNN